LPAKTLGKALGYNQPPSSQTKQNQSRFERQPSPTSPQRQRAKVADPMKAYTTRTVKTYLSPSRKGSPSPKAADGKIVPFAKAVLKGKAQRTARSKVNNDLLLNSLDLK
jgi:hypothetical protein